MKVSFPQSPKLGHDQECFSRAMGSYLGLLLRFELSFSSLVKKSHGLVLKVSFPQSPKLGHDQECFSRAMGSYLGLLLRFELSFSSLVKKSLGLQSGHDSPVFLPISVSFPVSDSDDGECSRRATNSARRLSSKIVQRPTASQIFSEFKSEFQIHVRRTPPCRMSHVLRRDARALLHLALLRALLAEPVFYILII